jgi:hypothetical protein
MKKIHPSRTISTGAIGEKNEKNGRWVGKSQRLYSRIKEE